MSDSLFGIHTADAILTQIPESILTIWVQPRPSPRVVDLLHRAQSLGISIQTVSQTVLAEKAQGGNHQGIVLDVQAYRTKDECQLKQALAAVQEQTTLYLVLDNIQDPHNFGSIIRTAEAFGVDGLIIPKANSARVTASVRKVACGAECGLAIYQVGNLVRSIELLKKNGIWVIGTIVGAPRSLYELQLTRSMALVFGNEQCGLRNLTRQHCDDCVSIPLSGKTASLNVAVSAGICIAELSRQKCMK